MKTRLSAVGLALILVLCDTSLIGLAARGASPAAFDRRCIPPRCVAPASNTPGILGRRALPAGRIAGLGATRDLHHGLLAQRESHCDFHQNVHRRALAARRREAPLSDGVNGSLIESGAEFAHQPHFTDRSIAADDNFHDNVAFDGSAPALVGINRLHLTLKLRGRDAAARTERSAAGAAT